MVGGEGGQAASRSRSTNRTRRRIERPFAWEDKVWLSWDVEAGMVLEVVRAAGCDEAADRRGLHGRCHALSLAASPSSSRPSPSCCGSSLSGCRDGRSRPMQPHFRGISRAWRLPRSARSREFPPARRRPALLAELSLLAAHRGADDADRARDRLPARLCDGAGAKALAGDPARPRHPAVLDLVPDPRLRLDWHPSAGRTARHGTDGHRADVRAAAACSIPMPPC
jgi:hypothetical protein